MEKTKYKKAALHLPNDLQYLPLAINFVQQNAMLRGFEEDQIYSIELVVEEAVSNVIKHAFNPEEQAEFSIICEQIPVGLNIIVKDKGMPFDPGVLPEYDPMSLNKDIPVQGLGWYLMQRTMDEVIFQNLGREGKEIHLIKYLHKETPGKMLEAEMKKEEKEPEVSFPPKSIPFKVRKAKPFDAIEITRCAYETYGYSYVFEPIYYPDRFGQLIDQGEILSVIAQTKDKDPQLMAHNSLVLDDPEEKIAMMGMTFTRKRYQNQGCGKKLGILLVKEAIKRGILGLTGTAITTHKYSQQGVYRAGVRTCAMLLGYFTDEFRWKDFSNTGQRETAVLGYFKVPLTSMLRLRGSKAIAAPKHHREMIEKIYKNLNRKISFFDSGQHHAELPEETSNISVHTIPYDKNAKITIKSYGHDIIAQLKGILNRLRQDKLEIIALYLNMTDPFTAKLTKDFEAMGFFFCGILPGPVKGDKLILQYLNNVKLDYDKIHLFSEFSKELLAYVKKHDPNKY